MTLSGSFWLAPDTVQIWDVSMRTKGRAGDEFHANEKSAPPWLAKLARAVSSISRAWDSEDDPALASEVFEQALPLTSDTLYPPYDKVWEHFFPGKQLSNDTPLAR